MEVASQVDISRALTIPGWMSEKELIWLATQAQKFEKIVEFGSFHGRSTRAMADNCDGIIWAVDPWDGNYPLENGDMLQTIDTFCMPQFLGNLREYINIKVIPVRKFSTSFDLQCQVDMVFIDGDHRFDTVVKDIEKAQKLVRNGGIISGHDYSHSLWTGVKQAVDKLLGTVEIVDTIWFKIKS